MQRSLAVVLAIGLCQLAAAQSPPTTTDPEVAKGIRAVDDGDYDDAIWILDQAARRLAADPARARDLSLAYLHLGIAYVGKGHEAAAKAKFREALLQVKELTLSPEKFAPKIIDLFEAARVEARQEATQRPKKGGGGKALLIGGSVAGAVGVGLAAAGGGNAASGSTAAGTPAPATTPAPANATESYQGFLNLGNTAASIVLPVVPNPGPWLAELTWTGALTEVRMFCVDALTKDGVAEVRLTSANSSAGDWPGQPGRAYEIQLFLQRGGAPESNYVLRVTHPR